ncbi:MAG TPA: peptidoglycan DD-metalloendopeptidase family protein [Solirubrobacteraceae bacterium]|nr:peptidoglycan DD-metalloendopeptidase family protein [Solirubrobacteraceae bacterium]
MPLPVVAWAAGWALALLVLWLIVSGAPFARAAGSGQLQQRLSTTRQKAKGLAGDVAAARGRVNQLSAGIAALSSRLAGVQDDLDAKRTELLRLRGELSSARAKLARLEGIVTVDQRVLATQLVGGYEGGRPDIIDVVLEATGFNDLLNRLAFAQRIGQQDARIVGNVTAARRAVSAQAIRLGTLSERQNELAEQSLTERNQVATLRLRLVSERLAAAQAASAKAGQLASATAQVDSLTHQLARLQAAQQAAASPPAPASGDGGSGSGSGSGSAGTQHGPVSHGFEFPMPKGDVSPPATWSPDDGVDIAAPGGTPELAVCSGTIVQHGIGGFGPSAPVLHCDRPLAGYDYVYYGHAGPGNWTPIGTHVSQGQVISQVGYGIVGISSGPHLEIGFADASGSPIGPSTASTMLSLLRSAYGA